MADDELITVDSKITLSIFDNGDEFKIQLAYNDELYSEDYIKTFIDSIKDILAQFTENDVDTCRICDVALKDDDGLHKFNEVEIFQLLVILFIVS